MSDTPGMSDAPILLPEQRFATPVTGPAYTLWARWTTASTVLGLLVYGAQVMATRPDVAWPVLMLMAAAAVVLLASTWYILTGKTTIDSRGIRQDWIFPKDYAWHEITRARLVRMPLMPRLVLMTPRGPFKAVHGGSRALLAAFADIDASFRR